MSDRRVKFRKDLHPLYLPFYDGLCAILPPEWDPFYGLRTFDEQNGLYAQGRSKPGKIVTNAPGGESPHNYGCASDWIVWENDLPIWMTSKDPRWKIYWDACDKVKAKKGKDWGDNPHNELPISISWRLVFEAYQTGGLMNAIQTIWEKRVK